jgi:hypothetical protein
MSFSQCTFLLFLNYTISPATHPYNFTSKLPFGQAVTHSRHFEQLYAVAGFSLFSSYRLILGFKEAM